MTQTRDQLKQLSLAELTRMARRGQDAGRIRPRPQATASSAQSYGEARQWFMQQLAVDAVYNVPQAMRIAGPLDAERLERALNRLALRHENLRTVYYAIDGVPSRIVQAPRPVARRVDLTGRTAAEQEAH